MVVGCAEIAFWPRKEVIKMNKHCILEIITPLCAQHSSNYSAAQEEGLKIDSRVVWDLDERYRALLSI